MTRTELLRDLFVWAYERSTREYIDVRRAMVSPSPERLRLRSAVREFIGQVVRDRVQDVVSALRRFSEAHVEAADREVFQELALDDLRRLHEGIPARYGLRPSELAAWRVTQRQD